MNNQFNKDSLNRLGIFELRNLAREIGVHSPTLYKKQEIINKILSIVSGSEEPYVARTKQGRPPKTISGVNNILDIFIPKNLEQEKGEGVFNNNDFVNLSNLVAMENNNLHYDVAEPNLAVEGILKLFAEGYGFCYAKGFQTPVREQNYFISNAFIQKYNLKTGDILKGQVKTISEDKPMIMYKIESINSIDAEKFNTTRKEFGDALAVYPNEPIKRHCSDNLNEHYINKFVPAGKGQRALIVVPQNVDYSPLINNCLNCIDRGSQKFSLICMLIEERPEEVTEYRSSLRCDKIVCTTFEDSPISAVQKIELELENAKRRVENGEDVIIFVSNLNRLENLYRKYVVYTNDGTMDKDDIKSKAMVKKFLTNARKTSDMGTLTIFAIIEEDGKDDGFLNSLKDLCNCQVYINANTYLKPNKIWFDIVKSNTRKAELLLTKEVLDVVVNFKSDLTESNSNQKLLELEKLLKN
ncbi:MAG: hypothetical protein AB7S44_04045 [Spirochaetales bacterium]